MVNILKWLWYIIFRGNKMKHLKLIRVAQTQDGTFGVLLDCNIPFCLTLERRWLNNKRNVSCIPAGLYLCRRIQSPHFGNTFKVLSVPKRKDILFHKGNINDDTHGCIIVGEYFEPLGSKNAVRASGKAFKEFLFKTNGINEFLLTIKEVK